MSNKEINTTTSFPEASYAFSEETFTTIPDSNGSRSNFVEIDFPKSRTIKFSGSKDVVRFSVNYEKIGAQLKNFNSNEL
ncbi:MAG: hypothetical protein ABI851_16440 [Saprospiraceae bacterium]